MRFILLLLLFTGCVSVKHQHLACVDHFLNKGMDGEVARRTCQDIYQNPHY